jgi:hypothetical protein
MTERKLDVSLDAPRTISPKAIQRDAITTGRIGGGRRPAGGGRNLAEDILKRVGQRDGH